MKLALTSDFHGYLPAMPEQVDVVIIAGDILPAWMPRVPTPEMLARARGWILREFFPWVRALRKPVICTWGNHDVIGMPQHRHYWDDEVDHCTPANLRLVVDGVADIGGHLAWCSPWSPLFMGWSFTDDEDGLERRYLAIPESTEILISHGPPFGVLDRPFGTGKPVGSQALRHRIDQLPHLRLVVCGHIHGDVGREDFKHGDRVLSVVNASLVDEVYRPRNPIVLFDLDETSGRA